VKFLSWFRDRWWARQRAVDLQILWPTCKGHAPDLDHARAAFAVHAFQDPCWVDHYGEDQLKHVISGMS
jgi:hypothetical protein